jgi:hypothetical protein
MTKLMKWFLGFLGHGAFILLVMMHAFGLLNNYFIFQNLLWQLKN